MSTVTFETEDATFTFRFSRKHVIECLEHRKSGRQINELETLIEVLLSQPEHHILSSTEHPYLGYIALDLIGVGEGSAFCKNCGKHHSFDHLEAFTVGPDDASFKVQTGRKGGLKSLFRKKTKLPGMQGGKGYKCPDGHTLIFMITWRT